MKKIIFQFSFTLALFLLSTTVFAQNFLYKREIKGVQNSKETKWYELKLPLEVIEKVNTDCSDIRILGVDGIDTLEAPYRATITIPTAELGKTHFNIINVSKKTNAYFFTLELPKNVEEQPSANWITLDFKNQNFDWSVQLEGSQNQEEWFELLNGHRIISIKNELTDYHFSSLSFSDSKYNFYRIKITDNTKNSVAFKNNVPKLEQANVYLEKTNYGELQDIKIISQKIKENKKQTIIDIELSHSIPINYIFLTVSNDFDYYRAIEFKYLVDSVKTEKGTIYNFETISSNTNTLSSLESINNKSSFFISDFATNEFVKSKMYRIVIENQDNQPLDIEKIEVKNFIYLIRTRISNEVVARKYFLMYGNENLQKPNYDISRFKNDIPKELETLELDAEQEIPQKEVEKVKPLFENSLWLWGLMGIIIIVLTFFTFKMMKKQ